MPQVPLAMVAVGGRSCEWLDVAGLDDWHPWLIGWPYGQTGYPPHTIWVCWKKGLIWEWAHVREGVRPTASHPSERRSENVLCVRPPGLFSDEGHMAIRARAQLEEVY